jgi:hypothetical protein
MDAHVGDSLVIEGKRLGQGRLAGVVLRVEGTPDHQRLWVRWDDGRESMFVPSSGVRLERKAT